MTEVPQCLIVIPSYNGAHLLSTCLEALFAHPPERCSWRVVIVDDASSDGTAERFKGYDERVAVVARSANGGFAKACNEGARMGGGADYLVFLNNDTVPLPGWLDALVDDASAHPKAAAVGSRLLFPDGTIQHAGVVIGHDRWPHHMYVGFPGEHPAVTRSKRVVAVTAACLLVRRSVYEDLDGFDTAFINGYEDIDFCLRLGDNGHEVRYCPRSVLYHLESVTRWADKSMRDTSHNDQLYEERWLDRVIPDDVEHYLADGLIWVGYGDGYPIRMSISPQLAAVQTETSAEDRLERLLSIRTEQVLELRAENIRATLKNNRDAATYRPTSSKRGRTGGETAEIVARGEMRQLGAGSRSNCVSLLMPLKNTAAELRQLLPLVLRQRVDTNLEIVAVDSGSTDDTVDVLREFGATVVAIDPADFDHGLTRNLAAAYAQGDVLVFLNARSRPCDENWLAPLLATLTGDPDVAGVCSRVLPHPDADPLTRRDGELDPSGSPIRSVKRIDDFSAYAAMPIEERRLLLNFHTVSAAIRAEVLREIPFQSVRAIGEDLLWSREVLEAGMALVHEAESRAYHSHDYSLRDWFMRNVDDGIANFDINERSLSEAEADALIRGMIASDWAYLRDELGLEGEDLEKSQIQAALRRVAQGAGQWLGVNHTTHPSEVVAAFSRVANGRRPGP